MEWRVIESHPAYEVSEDGQVRHIAKGRLLKQYVCSAGYPSLRLADPAKTIRVHRLVAAAFCPNPEGKESVNHIDFNRQNNHRTNLEWCTLAENNHHSLAAGRYSNDYWKGRRSVQAKLSDEAVQIVRQKHAGGAMQTELSREFGVSERAIWNIVHGVNYRPVTA